MSNPFFKQTSAPAPAPGLSGSIGRVAGAVQQASQIYRTLKNPASVIESALKSPVFSGYSGGRDAQSLLRYGCQQLGLDPDMFISTISNFVK